MKKCNSILMFGGFVFSFCYSSFAQEAKNFQQLKPTANPAYMLLGIAPTNIERPSTPKEFAASIQNAVVDGKVAPNFAMEITPYELFSKNNKVSYVSKAVTAVYEEKNSLNFFKNLSLSLASSATDTITLGRLKKGTSAAIGFKTTLINGRPSATTKNAIIELNKDFYAENIYNSIINRLDESTYNKETLHAKFEKMKESMFVAIDTSEVLTSTEKQVQRDMIDQIFNGVKDNFKSETGDVETTKITTYLQKKGESYRKKERLNLKLVNKKMAFAREGFILDMSAAYMGHFVANSWDSLNNAKWSAWTTFSYRINADKTLENVALVDFIGLVRYTVNDIKVDSSNYVDLGAKLQFTYNRISFSGEYIFRKLTQKPQSIQYDYTDRVTGNLEYVISNLITLKASIGRTFDNNSAVYDNPKDKLFAVGGINFSILSGQ